MNSSSLWVPRNAKALSCSIVASEGINLPTKPLKALTKALAKAPTKTSIENEEAIIQNLCDSQLCKQISQLAIDENEDEDEDEDQQDPKPSSKAIAIALKALKEAKKKEVARLTKLDFNTIMEEAKDPKDTLFTPFELGRYRKPEVVNIPPHIDPLKPLDLLDLFILPEMYAILAENTNKYAIVKNASIGRTTTNSRFWQPTNEKEMRVFFGVLIYMGCYKEPNYRMYWEDGKPDAPIHAIRHHMSINRFENLRRYLHVSDPNDLEDKEEEYEEVDEEGEGEGEGDGDGEGEGEGEGGEGEGDERVEETWWYKMNPLLSTFRMACKTHLIPGTDVAIDEIMVRFHGRSGDTCKMPNKPIKQGYKIFALADNDYV
jgi:DNA-directed RNA polymerase specialized sigma24 family protein